MARYLLIALLCAAFIIVPMHLRTLLDSKRELESARMMRAEQNHVAAIEHYRRAVMWRAPFNHTASDAAAEMQKFVMTLSDPAQRLDGLRELRSAILGSRSFLDSVEWLRDPTYFDVLAMAESEIAKAPESKPAMLREPQSFEPKFEYQIQAQLAFWAWILSVIYLIFRSFDRTGRLVGRGALLRAVPCAVFYALWLVMLARA